MKEQGLLLIVSGPSGAGKGTVVEALLARGGYALSISATTRPPRPYEQEGVHYFFQTEKEFEDMVQADGFLEHAAFCGHHYGTPKNYVLQQMAQGKHVILEIEVQGAFQVKDKYPEAVLLFLAPPSLAELKKRLEGRGTEDAQTIAARLRRAQEEMALVEKYDYLVVNSQVEDAVADIEAILRAEKRRCIRQKEFLQHFREGQEGLC